MSKKVVVEGEPAGECLRQGCTRRVSSRGLCCSCYTVVRAMISRGEVTWAALEKAGRARPVVRAPKGAIASWALGKGA